MRSTLAGPFTLRHARRATGCALFFFLAIVVTGATVRLTGSGLGCPDWPSCHGTRPIPAAEHHALMEFFNRTVSLPTTLAALAAVWVCRRLAAPRRDLRIASMVAFLGIPVQIVLGGLTVLLELPPLVVSAHFLVSIAILSAAAVAWVASGVESPPPPDSQRAAAAWLAGSMLVVLLAVIVAGVATTASGPHSGLQAGEIANRLGNSSLAVTLHARGAYVFATMLLVLVAWRVRAREGARDLMVMCTLVIIQITLGEIQYRNGLPWGIVLAHVTNAALLWTVACSIAWRAVFLTPRRG